MNQGDVFSYEDPRDILIHIFQEKKVENPQFSLRAWSKRLGFKNPSYLSDVLNGRRKLTADLALKISDRLGFATNERRYFETLTYFTNAKSDDEKDYYRTVIDRFKPEEQRRDVNPEWFNRLRYWYYGALDEMTCLKDFKEDYNHIAKRLGPEITPQAVEIALREVIEMGLVERDKSGRLRRPKKWMIREEESHSHPSYQPVRTYKRYFLEKGLTALDQLSEKESFYRQSNIPILLKHYEKVVELTEKFVSQIYDLQANKNADEVFHLGVLFYRLTHPLAKESNNE